MTEKAHSHIGASSMYRWASCPGSVRLSEGIESVSSSYAQEGTLAHEVAEAYLNTGKWPADTDDEMREHLSTYTDFIAEVKAAHPNCEVMIEHRFNLSNVYDGLFGTADAVIWRPDDRVLMVVDLKYGAGLAVEPAHNRQLMYYGLGALLSLSYPALAVELVIVQPRCFHPDGPIRSWSIPSFDLIEFRADLIAAAKATEDPKAPLAAGEWCRFCPALRICPLVQKKQDEMARRAFSPVLSYDPADLAKALGDLDILESKIKATREFAYAEAEHGRCPPGYKLVDKIARRKIKVGVEDEMAKAFGVDKSELFAPAKLLGVSEIEKVAPGKNKKEREAALAPFVSKDSTGQTLVHESDKRPPAKREATEVFSVVTEES